MAKVNKFNSYEDLGVYFISFTMALVDNVDEILGVYFMLYFILVYVVNFIKHNTYNSFIVSEK